MYMDKTFYKNIVFGILSWYKFSGRKSVYRTEVSESFRVQGAVTVSHYDMIIGAELSDMMEEFALQNNGILVKEFDDNGNVIKGSVRVIFN